MTVTSLRDESLPPTVVKVLRKWKSEGDLSPVPEGNTAPPTPSKGHSILTTLPPVVVALCLAKILSRTRLPLSLKLAVCLMGMGGTYGATKMFVPAFNKALDQEPNIAMIKEDTKRHHDLSNHGN